jgi:DNA-binding transcriptional ArsR family regulator
LLFGLYFHILGNMETKDAVQALAALAQDTRLAIFRLLVAAGQIGDRLDLPPATLSFHLAGLARAGLAQSRQVGRFVIYSADFQAMNALVGYLSENCCGGRTCHPSTGETHETPTRARRRA